MWKRSGRPAKLWGIGYLSPKWALFVVGSLGMLCWCGPVYAQNSAIVHLGRFFGVGGYFFTGSARGEIGTPKFYSDTTFYVRPARLGLIRLTGGVEILSAADHFLPFTGGSEFRLIGLSGRAMTRRTSSGLRPYVTAGLYAGRLKSDRTGMDRTEFTPSGALGVEWRVLRYVTLGADYRVNGRIGGVNTDGFSLSLRLF